MTTSSVKHRQRLRAHPPEESMPEISGTASHRGRLSRSYARSIGPHVAGRTLRARDCPIYRHARPLESQARASSPALRLERPHPGAALPWTRTMGGPSSPARSGGRLAVPSLTLLTGLLDGSRSVRVEVTWLFARERDLDALLGALVIDAALPLREVVLVGDLGVVNLSLAHTLFSRRRSARDAGCL